MGGLALMSGQTRYLLVVDSDWNDRFTLSMLLQRFGYTVASTSNAAEGIEFLCVAPAEAVVAEVGEAGMELMERLKADPRFRSVPLILVGERNRALEEKARAGELTAILRTPLDPNDVYQVIQQTIEKTPRTNIRIETDLRAALNGSSGPAAGFVTVLSQLGLFFRTLQPLPINSRATVQFFIWERTVAVEAQVLYTVTFEEGPFCEPGMGMKFVSIAPENSALIRMYIYEQLGVLPPEPGGQA